MTGLFFLITCLSFYHLFLRGGIFSYIDYTKGLTRGGFVVYHKDDLFVSLGV
jgi:hypothetical protein